MKHLFFLSKLFVGICFALLFGGCKKDNASNINNNTDSASHGEYIISTDGYIWSNSQWKPLEKDTYTFDADCKSISVLGTIPDSITGGWNNYYLTTLTRNPNGTIATETAQIWSDSSSTWTNSVLATYNYLNSDTNRSSVVTENWINNQWKNVARSTYTYDNNNHLTHILVEKLNDTANEWIIISQTDYTYNSDGKMSQALSFVISTTLYTRTIYTYNTKGKLDNALIEIAFSSPDNWIKSEQYVQSYNIDAQVSQTIFQFWDPLNNIWFDNEKIVYNYSKSCH